MSPRAIGRLLLTLVLMVGITFAAEQPPEAASEVTIELFSDFQCPFCKQFARPIRELQAKGIEGVQTTVKFRNFPLSFHTDSQLAHQAALAAGEQGEFWDMHDLLFANQSALKREDLLRYAERLGLDMDRFRQDLDSDRIKRIIEADKAEGAKRGVSGTPTFFLNGKEYSGARSFDQLKELIQGEEKRIRAVSEITDNLLSKGPADAPVTLEFFADLESLVSRPASRVLNQVLSQYPTAVRLQFRNFPLAFHPQAGLAHDAAMAAAKEGRFWEVAAYILEHQDSLREQDLIAYVGRLGLDENKFAEKLQQRTYRSRVEADLAEGFKRGIRGSPVIFVNARRIDGVPSLQTLAKYIEAELDARK